MLSKMESKVGPLIFKIEFEEDPQILFSNERCFGYCDSENAKIVIDKNLSDIQKKFYLMHEIVEQICAIYFLELNHEQKGIIGNAFFNYLRENPKIIEYIKK